MRLLLVLKAVIPMGLAFGGAAVSAGACQMEKKAELALGYANGVATAEARINGSPVIMGLDTGTQSLVTPQTAERLGLIPGFTRSVVTRGTTGQTVAEQVMLLDFEFAGAHHGLKSVTKVKLPAPKIPEAKPIAGLIGMDILANYDLDFDFPQRKLTLYEAKGCASTAPQDFADSRAIPFTYNNERNIFFPIEVDGKTLSALLDTGSVRHSITRSGLKKAGVAEAVLNADPLIELVGVGNIAVKNPLHRFSTLAIGGVEYSDVELSVLSGTLGQGDALIGQSYLFARRVRISNSARMLYVENKLAERPGTTQLSGIPSNFSSATVAEEGRHGPGLP